MLVVVAAAAHRCTFYTKLGETVVVVVVSVAATAVVVVVVYADLATSRSLAQIIIRNKRIARTS